ncbi:MAG: hypothetical protein PUC06_05485 [Oscillospiraceae bacterium]|nr:hypothetical protein [Oscillospiraceae bacterium]
MDTIKIPTSADIYLEVNGVKVAVVQSYRALTTRESKNIEAFGHQEPVATIRGLSRYSLELSRIYATENALRDGINFYELEDFSLVIVKPDRRVIFTGCQWTSLEESTALGGTVMEKVSLTASSRMELMNS